MKFVWESWNAQFEHKLIEENESESVVESGDFLMMDNDIVFTPIGPFHNDDPLRPSKRWACFMCYTDFDIGTQDFVDIIDNTEGVEGFSLMGNYSFFIGFGKLFDPEKVKEKIKHEVKRYVEFKEVL
jgi:hypothetical protein